MAWTLESDRPIYVQLMERMQMQIVAGQYLPGEKLPSVREAAVAASVNPNTMQKAFVELEKSGIIITQRTNGRNVTEDRQLIEQIRQELAEKYTKAFGENMRKIGFAKQEMLDFLARMPEEGEV